TVAKKGYTENLEPVPSDWTPPAADVARGPKAPWSYLLKPTQKGEVHVQARGKELFIAAGYHGVRFHFGLEAIMLCVSLEDFLALTAKDCPGPSKDKTRAAKMRSFRVPERFYVPGSVDGGDRRINIFAAIVCDDCAFIALDFSRMIHMHVISLDRFWTADDLQPGSSLWPELWDVSHGPDWIDEHEAALASLEEWRLQMLKQDTQRPIVQQLCSAQFVFNGFGMHLANDFLFSLAFWPGTPASVICANDELFNTLKNAIQPFMTQWVSSKYRKRVCSNANTSNPLVDHNHSYLNFVNQYVHVYRRQEVRVPTELYNCMVLSGLLDEAYTISFDLKYELPSTDKLTTRSFKKLPVFKYRAGSFGMFYSVIRAQRPDDWSWAFNGILAKELKHAGYQTTLGPAEFRNNKENKLDPKRHGHAGRRKKV
ncbi:hypothetical protein CERSUDRAFT_47298, partial [Gelatoporia subvermispora B]